MPIRILLVDDHKVLRDGLRSLLESEPDMRIIAEADNGQQAIQLALGQNPDIVIMDLGLPDMSGLEAIRQIRSQDQSCGIIVLSMYSRKEFVRQAIEAGANGYVPKSSAHTSLLRAIWVVQSGERYLHPKAATALVESITSKESEAELYANLSDREQEVLKLTALGFTSREIGQQLVISPKTAESYRQRAMEKLNLDHRSDVIRFALRAGILDDFI
ncbi:MAG TPA: response regulator transcription factor [Anaerolineales bacterium]|nr:response regulator transcription factor [Anaerolineales bacterium]